MSPQVFCLPDRISVTEENALLPFLQANRDQPVEIAAGELQRLDTRLLQCLIAAAADWQARGLAFLLSGLGPDHARLLAQLGVTEAHLRTDPSPLSVPAVRGAA